MSDSAQTTRTPRAMIHQRIMDVAADRPDASVDSLADAVPGASAGMVERVLDEYGDPADDGTQGDAVDTAKEGEEQVRLDSLTEAQQETMLAISRRPTATQRELAAELGVTAATISQRVGGIPDFEWSDRATFVETLEGMPPVSETDAAGMASDTPESEGIEGETSDSETPDGETAAGTSDSSADDGASSDPQPDEGESADRSTHDEANHDSPTTDNPTTNEPTTDQPTPESEGETGVSSSADEPVSASTGGVAASDGGSTQVDGDRLGHIQDRLTQLEGRLESVAEQSGEAGANGFEDPALAAKVVRACVSADDIDETEEVAIIETLLD